MSDFPLFLNVFRFLTLSLLEQYQLPVAEQEILLEEAGVTILRVSFSKSKLKEYEYNVSWKSGT